MVGVPAFSLNWKIVALVAIFQPLLIVCIVVAAPCLLVYSLIALPFGKFKSKKKPKQKSERDLPSVDYWRTEFLKVEQKFKSN